MFKCGGFVYNSWIHRYDLSDQSPLMSKIFQRISKVMEIPLYNGYPLTYSRDISEDIMGHGLLCNIFLKSKTVENELLYIRQKFVIR